MDTSKKNYEKVSWTLLVKLYVRKYIKEGKAKAEEWAKKEIRREYFPILKPLIIDKLRKSGLHK